MSLRPGSKEAIEFYKDKSSNIINEWNSIITEYKLAIYSLSKSKNKKDLIDLDNFWLNEFKNSVQSRSPQHMTLCELSDIMKWKLIRGKARPLQVLL
jgi:hypothetical protein